MRFALPHSILAAAVMAAAALTPSSAMAAEATLTVPFSFTAAGKTLPAGLYSVREDLRGDIVYLSSKQSSQTFSWLIGPGPDKKVDRVSLKFDHTGDSYALRSIQVGPKITARLDKGTAESEREITAGGR